MDFKDFKSIDALPEYLGNDRKAILTFGYGLLDIKLIEFKGGEFIQTSQIGRRKISDFLWYELEPVFERTLRSELEILIVNWILGHKDDVKYWVGKYEKAERLRSKYFNELKKLKEKAND